MSSPTFTLTELEAFLCTAYQAAWPHNVITIADGSRFDSFEEVSVDQQPWSYRDLFYGSANDAGLEVVRFHGMPVWANTYRGGLTVPAAEHDVFAFLIEALDAPGTPSTFRIRGPKIFQRAGNPLVYRYTGHGDLRRFYGIESISLDQTILYERTLAGSLIGAAPIAPSTELSAVLSRVHAL